MPKDVMCENESCKYCKRDVDNVPYCTAPRLLILESAPVVWDYHVLCAAYKSKEEYENNSV